MTDVLNEVDAKWIHDVFPGYFDTYTEGKNHSEAPWRTSTWTEGDRTLKVTFKRSERDRCGLEISGLALDAVCGLPPGHDGPHVSVAAEVYGRLVADISIRTRVSV